MQTFLPDVSFYQSLRVLDDKRLGKQRVESFQILNILLDKTTTKGWRNHPAVLMWQGYENALIYYYNLNLWFWKKRGFRNIKLKIIQPISEELELPSWIGSRIHSTHRAALLKKLPEHYNQFGWIEEPKIDYYWPTQNK